MKARLGIIGTGIAARDLHLPALNSLRDKFEITCVCNHTEKKAREFSELAGNVPWCLDYHDLLSRSDVDAVDIVLPIHLNFKVTLDSLEAGKHVMLEKPIAASLSDAELMLTFPERFELVMMVAENFRYSPTFKKVREIIEAGRIGTPYSVFWDLMTTNDRDNKYTKTEWRINHRYPGGFVMDAGVHYIAALRDLFGEIKRGIAATRSVNPEIGKMDSMTFQFVFESGVNGVFNAYFSAQGVERNRLLVLGTAGSLVVEMGRIVLKRKDRSEIEEVLDQDMGYRGEFEDFHDCIVNKREPVSTFEKAFDDFRTMLMALDSASKWDDLEFGK